MTPEQRLIAKWIGILLILGVIFFSGFGVRGYMANAEMTKLKLDQQVAANATLSQYADDLKGLAVRNEALRNQVHRLDVTHTGKLNEELAENRRLRNDLATSERMRLKGSSCPTVTSGNTATSPGVDDGTAVMLSGATRQLVWDLRESLIYDRRKLAYLQEERTKLTCEPKSPG